MTVPVVLLVFSRPAHTAQVLDQIRTWPIPRLYVGADGPRPEMDDDVESCQMTRRLIESADLPYPVHTWFRDEHAGCGVAVSEAISWFFEHEPAGIILEDDCVPRRSFLPYCDELLNRYRDVDEVMTISGNNFLYRRTPDPRSYSFIRQPQIWGWATWSRAWQHFDYTMGDWPNLRSSTWLSDICSGHRDAVCHWEDVFDRTHRDEIDSWAYRWTFSCWTQHGLSISPGANLVDNIGFDARATHTRARPHWLDRVSATEMEFPLEHPVTISRDFRAERWIDRHVFGTRPALPNRMKHRIARIIR